MPTSQSLPTQSSPTYCVDEDVAVHAGGDYTTLALPWNQLAYGVDGAFAPNAPWVLTSASNNFEQQGVTGGNVIWLTTPKSQFPGGGQLLAVESTSGSSATLRRIYKDVNVGQPPAPIAGLTQVTFNVLTFADMIAEASYDLKQRFTIEDLPLFLGNQHSSQFILDRQVLRVATVYTVLLERYTQESRTERGDFEKKVVRFRQKLDDAISRVQVRWQPIGSALEPTSLFSCKVCR